MRSPVIINRLMFQDGSIVDTEESDVIVLVGPNGSGKSRTLGDVLSLSANGFNKSQPGGLITLADVVWNKRADASELDEWMRANRFISESIPGQRSVHANPSHSVALDGALARWNLPDNLIQPFGEVLVRFFGPGQQMNLLTDGNRVPPGSPPQNAVDMLLQSSQKLQTYKNALRRAFGFNLIVDGLGSSIQLKTSRTAKQKDFRFETIDGRPTPEAYAKFAPLRGIQTESDGVRSFAGILLAILGEAAPIVLIDEPETFLHPPQARQIGAALAGLREESQVFVATHSLDVLLGI